MRWVDEFMPILIFLFFICVWGVCSTWTLMHPCKRSQQVRTACGGDMVCAAYDGQMNCMIWQVTDTYPCVVTECLER